MVRGCIFFHFLFFYFLLLLYLPVYFFPLFFHLFPDFDLKFGCLPLNSGLLLLYLFDYFLLVSPLAYQHFNVVHHFLHELIYFGLRVFNARLVELVHEGGNHRADQHQAIDCRFSYGLLFQAKSILAQHSGALYYLIDSYQPLQLLYLLQTWLMEVILAHLYRGWPKINRAEIYFARFVHLEE